MQLPHHADSRISSDVVELYTHVNDTARNSLEQAERRFNDAITVNNATTCSYIDAQLTELENVAEQPGRHPQHGNSRTSGWERFLSRTSTDARTIVEAEANATAAADRTAAQARDSKKTHSLTHSRDDAIAFANATNEINARRSSSSS